MPGKLHVRPFFNDAPMQGIWLPFPAELNIMCDTRLPPLPQQPSVQCLGRRDCPTEPEWTKLVRDACQKIDEGRFSKVVLARRTTLTLDTPLNSDWIFHRLASTFSHASLYAIQIEPNHAFLGASPELLFIRKGKDVAVDVLAGTCVMGESWTDKEYREVGAVGQHIRTMLDPLCSSVEEGPLHERTWGKLRHLYQNVRGTLRDTSSDDFLISALHPTPALGGFPREAALEYIRTVESWDRGWYGAPLGAVSADGSQIAVAIRSMVIRGCELHLFAGAGIVRGSCPHREWEELDRKIEHVLQWVTL